MRTNKINYKNTKLLHIRKIAVTCILGSMLLSSTHTSAALLKIGTKNSEVKVVQSVLKDMGYYKYSKTTGYYGTITKQAVIKFQKKNGLVADGIVGNETKSMIKKLSTNTNAEVKGTSISNNSDLDWFSKVRSIWKRGENAIITDVDTGLSFDVKRTYGTNHADVEPLTKEDTKTIKKIWGGFTWERRAVVVEVNGYVIAASMTSVAHAGLDSKKAGAVVSNRSDNYGRGTNLDAVKNNGADGVMDIHFKNSRTHSTNVKQESHQSMIRKAKEYILEKGL